MKKTLVALSVLAAATSAQAIELYNQDGVTVGLHGDIEVVYMEDKTPDAEFQQEIQDADFGFDVRYAINDDLSFGGYWSFDGADGSNNPNTTNGDTYVALYSKSLGSIKAGRVCSVFDDAGIGSDFQFGIKSFFQNSDSYCTDESVRYDIDKGNVYFSAAFTQDKLSNDPDFNLGVDGSHYDAKLGYRVADFDFTVFLGETTQELKDQKSTSENLWAVEARYAGVENLELALAYYVKDGNLGQAADSADITADTISAAATYTVEKVTFAAGYSVSDADGAEENLDSWFLNAGYALAPNTTAYVEVGADNGKTNVAAAGQPAEYKDNGTGLAIGVKAEF